MAADTKAQRQYIDSLTAGVIVFPRLVIGTLEPQPLAFLAQSRADKGWPARATDHIEVRKADIEHQMKRLGEGLTPAEMWRLVECVLHPKATARRGPNGRCLLLYSAKIELEPGCPFTPQGIVMDGLDWKAPRLYGLIPKGWAGRKK